MADVILFKETQRFPQGLIWLILVCTNGPLHYFFTRNFIRAVPFDEKPITSLSLTLVFLLSLIIIIFFLIIRLETIIKEDGIYVRFYPFHSHYRIYTWDSISQAYVREYKPIAEYGGWGMRMGLFGSGPAFNISGNKGIQLVFHDNSKLLIGTQRPDEMTEVLRRIGF